MADRSSRMNRSPNTSRESSYERAKSYMAKAMQPGDSKSTSGRLPPDEREAILPMREDENPLYGQRQSTENNGSASARERATEKGKGMMQSAGDTVVKALGRRK